MYIEEQERVLNNDKKNMIVSASAGSGKTYVLIQYICKLIVEKRVPIKKFLILTFTKAAAAEMKERLLKNLKAQKVDEFILKQIDDLSTSNISTIHAFCEYCLKKYANLLQINENFSIADENFSKKLKIESLKQLLKAQENSDLFIINSAYKNNDRKITEIVFQIESMIEAVSDKDKFIEKVLNEQEKLFDNAVKIIFENVCDEFKNNLAKLDKMHFNDIEFAVRLQLQNLFKDNASFEEKLADLNNFSFPALPKKTEIDEKELETLKFIRKSMNDTIKTVTSLFLNQENIEKEKTGILEKSLMNLFLSYKKEYERRKKLANVLDFSDLEQNMLRLSTFEMFNEGFDYVFIDEYQDTNYLQEKIVKKVAENCNFVAVGDAKQGIYGFRLASSDIFLKDVKDFTENENSNAIFLKSNFRSDERILDFVNDVFKDVMTEDVAKIDYKNTSMLSPKKEYKDDGEKAVTIDLVESETKEEKNMPIYSVEEDVATGGVNKTELACIKARLEQILQSKIYDPDKKEFRNVEFKDIAILSRSRNTFFNELGEYLKDSGFPVIANSRTNLLDNSEIMILHNVLKVTLYSHDDIALLSVLMSAIGKFDQVEIFENLNKYENNLQEMVKKDEKFHEFNKIMTGFRNYALCYGYRDAFEWLFAKVGYMSYINAQHDLSLLSAVAKFLDEIENSGYNFDLPNLINYFESVDISDEGSEISEPNAILLTTIHKTKGLEYPIVILINSGRNLKRAQKKGDVRVDDELGIAVKNYLDDSEEISVKMFASDLKNEKKLFVEEMMIFYVALTRAKNRLYLVGERKREKPKNIIYNSYFDFVLNMLDERELDTLFDGGELDKGSVKYNIIDEVEEVTRDIQEKIIYGKFDEKLAKNIENYINFSYFFKNNENISFKNSVTSLTKKFEDSSVFQSNSEMVRVNRTDAIEIGNAYHLALKVIDFEKVNSLETLQRMVDESEMLSDVKSKIDTGLLYKDILTMKQFCGGKVFKEKEFIMKDALNFLIEESEISDKVMVQGVVDFFAIKKDGKVVLVDYKYSNEKNSEKLKNRYKLQLKLYKNAIENGFSIKVDEIYLLNIKYNLLIKYENV